MNMNVSLPDELANYIKAKVSTGHYGSSSEVVREALRLMVKIEQDGREIARLRQAWDAGKVSGVAGEMDFDALRAEGRKRVGAAKETAARGK